MSENSSGKKVFLTDGYQPAVSIEKGYQPTVKPQSGYKPTAAGGEGGPSNPPASGSAESKKSD